jgi:eukaryotic-like serine/threonine-protein kinase
MPVVGDVLLDRYRLESVIGEGGMGLVYCARQLPSDVRVAIKVLSNEALTHPESLPRFIIEARATMQLQSPHVVKVHEVGTLDHIRPFIIMELLEGADLGKLIERRKHLPIAEAVDYVIQAADAIADAHANGIVHRDLKPSNLFLTSKTHAGGKSNIIKVLDFGISKVSGEIAMNHALTATGALLGTPQYMSPEQLKNAKDVDGRADIWSLGIILYELIAGKPPFNSTHGAIFAQVLTSEYTPLRDVRPNLPDGVDAAVTRCLRKMRDERFADLSQLVQALAPFASPDGARTAMRIRRAVAGDREPASPRTTAARAKFAGTALMADRPALLGSMPQSTREHAKPFNPHALPPLPMPPSQQQIETVPSSTRIARAQVAGIPPHPQSSRDQATPSHYAGGQPLRPAAPPPASSMTTIGLAIGLAVFLLAVITLIAVVRMRAHADTPDAKMPAGTGEAPSGATPTHSDLAPPPLPMPTAPASNREGASHPTPRDQASAVRATTAATSSILDKRK